MLTSKIPNTRNGLHFVESVGKVVLQTSPKLPQPTAKAIGCLPCTDGQVLLLKTAPTQLFEHEHGEVELVST